MARKWSFDVERLDARLPENTGSWSDTPLYEFIEAEIKRNIAEALEKVRLEKWHPQRIKGESDESWTPDWSKSNGMNLAVDKLNSNIAKVRKEYGIE